MAFANLKPQLRLVGMATTTQYLPQEAQTEEVDVTNLEAENERLRGRYLEVERERNHALAENERLRDVLIQILEAPTAKEMYAIAAAALEEDS